MLFDRKGDTTNAAIFVVTAFSVQRKRLLNFVYLSYSHISVTYKCIILQQTNE